MNRATVDREVSGDERAAMEAMARGIQGCIDGQPASLALSVLGQILIGNIGDGDQLTDAEFYNRTVGVLSLINLFRDGKSGREYDQVGFVEAVHDLTSIINCGSRALMVPALASVLVAAVANGRRNYQEEGACVAAIQEALKRFDVAVGPQ